MAVDAGKIYSEVRIKLDRLSADINSVNAKLDVFNAKNTQKAGFFSQAWGKAFNAIKLAGVGAFILIGKKVADAIKTFAGYQQSMANVASVTRGSAEEINALGEAAKNAGETTRFRASQAADALYYLASAGFDAQQSISALNGVLQLAGATQSDLAFTSETVASVISQYNLDASEATRISNVFAAAIANSQATMEKLSFAMQQVGPVAAGMGISLEETTGALQILFNAGFQGQKAGRALKSALADLAAPTSSLKEKFRELGIDLAKVNPQFNSLDGIINEIAKSGANTSDIISAFGKVAGPQMAVLIKKGSDALKKYTQDVTNTNAAAEAYAIQNDTLAGSFDFLASKAESVALAFGEQVEPGLRDTLLASKNLLNIIGPLVSVFGSLVGVMLKVIATPINAFFAAFGDNAKKAAPEVEAVTSAIKNANDAIEKAEGLKTAADKVENLTDEYERLASKTDLTKAEQGRLREVIAQIENIVPQAVTKFDDYGNAIEISGEKSRKAAKQLLLNRKAVLENAKATLEVSAPLYESVTKLRASELKQLKEEIARNQDLNTRNETRVSLLKLMKIQLEGIIESQVAYGAETNRSIPKSTELILRHEKELRRLGLTQIVREKTTKDLTGLLELFDSSIESAEQGVKEFNDTLKEKIKVELEVKEAQNNLQKIVDLEKQIEELGKQAEKIDIVDPGTDDGIDELSETANKFWNDFNNNLNKATQSASIFGSEQDVLRAKVDFLKTAYLDLLNQGLDPASTTLTKLKNLYDENANALKKFGDTAEDIAEPIQTFFKSIEDEAEIVKEIVSELSNALISLSKATTDARLEDLDRQMQAELESKGLLEETETERLERELAEAQKAGDIELASEKKKALERAKIEEKYEKQKAELQYKAANNEWMLKLLSAGASAAEAIIKAIASAPFPASLPAIGFATVQSGLQIATVTASKPQPPAFQYGGIVPGNSMQGDNIEVKANAGEMFFNRSQQQRLLDIASGNIGAGNKVTTVIIPVNLDGVQVAELVADVMNDGTVTLKPERALRT